MPKRNLDPDKIIDDLFEWARQYGVAAGALRSINAVSPKTHVRGQWVELALKTYLAACKIYMEGHDLAMLATDCKTNGMTITKDDETLVIEPLNKKYFRDDVQDWDFATRYPQEDRGTTVWLMPGHDQVADFVKRVLDQASACR